jgi:hypothetical protein
MDLTMMERVGDRWEKMEGSCSTGQSPQWAVVPVEEEEVLLALLATSSHLATVSGKRAVSQIIVQLTPFPDLTVCNREKCLLNVPVLGTRV